ncbi:MULTISPECIES: M48 family metallopeptidase [Clostridium]|uniref:M48 family metallopeptidase n=1 Tax=Clostridium TaxID=1485 RepID=UPI0006A7D62E|nr:MULTISPECIES: SprT family zinc-dependent metalloprotease [Clostridium]MDU1116201.1 SprT family zinc-dependent metalloprotease [Clostridium sp.]MDU7713939.1 SprT family zinc-dependent metalloprotease [Clostridium butyricum]
MIVSGMEIEVTKKDIKNIHLGVYPPDGRVRVAAPKNTTDENIRLLIVSKLRWIKKQKEKFASQERQSKREYVSGESYYLWGERFNLRVVERDNAYSKVQIENKKYLTLYVKHGTEVAKREEIITEWYRKQIKEQIPKLISKWEPTLGVEVKAWGVKKMSTKWGTCNNEAGRIWLNLYLAKRPHKCLEYVVVHEMTHLLERTHSDRFKELMDTNYPTWKSVRDELNSFILEAYEK